MKEMRADGFSDGQFAELLEKSLSSVGVQMQGPVAPAKMRLF